MDPAKTQNVLAILQIALTAEPAVLQAIMTFVQKTQGRPVAEIVAATDAMWANIGRSAQAEIDAA